MNGWACSWKILFKIGNTWPDREKLCLFRDIRSENNKATVILNVQDKSGLNITTGFLRMNNKLTKTKA